MGSTGAFDSYMGKSSTQFSPSMNLIFDPNTINALASDPNELEKYYRKYILHEFGHAIGLVHEHQNPARSFQWDRTNMYRVYSATYGWQPWQVDQQVLQPYANQQALAITEFDYKSIMLYPIFPNTTIPSMKVDWNDDLSALDKYLVNLIYPFTETELAVGSSANGSISKPGEPCNFRFLANDDGRYVIETNGSTPVQIYLFGPGLRGMFLEENHGPAGSVNAKIDRALNAGWYYLQARHLIPTGTGSFGISVKQV